MAKAFIIVAVIAAAIFFGVKYHQSHPGGSSGITINSPVIRPPTIPDPLKT
ncbi:MAG TPA: hypothetical protein VKV69_09515 [Actinomycetota bacterium]|nr:hypothetical protein [Actinomycetota bacterium]